MSLLREAFGLPTMGASALSDLQHPTAWLTEAMGGGVTTAGERVNSSSALTVSAFYAALRNISEDVGNMPVKVFEKVGKRREMREDEPAYRLLNVEANPYMSAQAARETMLHFALGWGGGIAEISRDGTGKPAAYWPIHADRVKEEWHNNALWYRVALAGTGVSSNDRDKAMLLPARDVFHVHGLGPTGVGGYSLLKIAAESLGLSLASQKFGAAIFGNGANIGTVLIHPDAMDPKQKQNLREGMEAYKGASEANKTLILEGGTKIEKLGLPPEEAQMLETRQFQVEEVARWVRMPPHKLQSMANATFSNIEHQAIEYVVDTLTPWAGRYEREASRKLIRGDSVQVKHNFESLLRGDSKARAEHYKSLFMAGSMTPNQIREKEDLEPSDDPASDDYYIQGAMVPLSKIGEEPPAPEPPVAPPVELEEEPEEEGDDEANATTPSDRFRDLTGSHRVLFMDAAERCVRREASAVKGPESRFADNPKGFMAWANGFYSNHRGYTANQFEPVLAVLSDCAAREGLLVKRVEQRIGAYLDGWQADALRSIATLYHKGLAHQTLSENEPERAAMLADDMARLIIEAATETHDA